MIKISIINAIFDFFCLNTKCEMFMIDRLYLCKFVFEYKLRIKKFASIKVRSIDKTIITFSERIELEFDIFEFFKEKSATAKIKNVFHIVDNLTIKILINMNIIESKRMKIDFQKVQIESCDDMIANFKTESLIESKIKRVVTNFEAIIISFHFNMFVAAQFREKFKVFSDRDFVFNSTHDQRLNDENDIFSHIVNVNFSCVQVRNATNESVFISRRCRLEFIQKYENEKCYLIFSNDAHLTAEQ